LERRAIFYVPEGGGSTELVRPNPIRSEFIAAAGTAAALASASQAFAQAAGGGEMEEMHAPSVYGVLQWRENTPFPEQGCTDTAAVQAVGRVRAAPILGGLHHQYARILFPTGTSLFLDWRTYGITPLSGT
jgi:hypothetical protein